MIKTRLRYCVYDPDPAGNERYYVRKKGHKKIRIPEKYDDGHGGVTESFMKAYFAALATLVNTSVVPSPSKILREDTFDWLCDQYFRSEKFKAFDPATQRDKKSVLNRFCAQAGSLSFKRYRQSDMEKSQLKRRDTPGAADKLVKVLRALFNWAIKAKLATHNPASNVGTINSNKEGFHTWSPGEVDQYRSYYPIGTKARLALELMINVGARRSDAAQIGKRHELTAGGKRWLRITAHKNRDRFPTIIELPMLPELVEALEKTAVGERAYLVTEHGKPFSIEGFGNRMREWCDKAGLPQCSSHGLRKAAAVKLAESGSSGAELCAIFGWSNLKTAQIYIRKAEKRRMSGNAFDRLETYQNSQSVSVFPAK